MTESSGYTIEHGLPDDGLNGEVSQRQDRLKGSGRAAKPAAVPVEIGNAADLRRMTFPPIRFVIPGYIAEGCTLLAGRPKLGKSWLVLEAGLAVAGGGTCLGGIACEQGDVLYLALEDNRRRLQRRIDKLLGTFAADWPAAFEYATEWPRANEGGLDRIREWVVAKPNPRLVVVDVLAMFKPVRGSSESLYEADYAAIKGLQALAGEHGVAVVVVHHTRKNQGDGDPFEKVSGTLGLSGAADTTVILDRDGNGATLYGRGRDIEEIESAVVFDKPGSRWFVQGEAAEVRRTDERGAVLAALEGADEPMGPGEIATATGASRNAIDQRLYKMAKVGEVLKAGRGRYVHPTRTDLIESRASTPRKNDKSVRNLADYRAQKAGQVLTHESPLLTAADPPIRTADDAGAPPAGGAPPASYHLTDLTGGIGTDESEPAPNENDLAEGRLVADAEARTPGIVRQVLDGLLTENREPTQRTLNEALREAVRAHPLTIAEVAPKVDYLDKATIQPNVRGAKRDGG